MLKGKRVRNETKKIVCNVYDYVEPLGKKRKSGSPLKLCARTAAATGYSKHTVYRIMNEKTPFAILCMSYMPGKKSMPNI